jgi:alpha-N-arabinofuranosidase
MTLDVFNRHPEKVTMANCAQLINCLNSLYLAHEDRFVVTPVGQVFELYAAHQGGQGVRALFSAPAISYDRDGKPATFWGLKGSGSLKGKKLFLTVVNPRVSESQQSEIVVHQSTVRSATLTSLTSPDQDIHGRNTFEHPDGVRSATEGLKTRGTNSLTVTFPAASVSALSIELG